MVDFFAFQVRPRVLFKAGIAGTLGPEIERLRGKRAVIIADSGVTGAGLLDRVRAGLAGAAEVVGVFGDVPPGSSVQAVERAAAFARERAADLLVAVGGGSPIDTAKAVRILLAEGGALRDHQGATQISRALLPLVAIPTTTGSGSEVSSWAIIRDEQAQVKLSFAHAALAPDLAILDPELTRTLPPPFTAASGIDALTHAIEAFVGTNANPISDILALQAVDMISNNLRDATYDSDDLAARGALQIAACIAGMAFSSGGGGLGIGHALAHAIGGRFYELPHGSLNAIILPYAMQFNSMAVPNRFARIARYMGVNSGGRPEEDVIADGIDAVRLLAADCGLPTRLRDVGVPEDALAGVAEVALADRALLTNPRSATLEDMAEVARAAW